MNRTKSARRWLLTSAFAAATFAPGTHGAQGPKSPPDAPSPPVVVEVRGDSFDWTDAGVGAAATLAVGAIGLGLVLVLRDRSEFRPSPRQE